MIDKKGRIGILGKHVIDVEFDHSILIWHIATYLFSSNESEHSMKRRETSKCLSEYMLYLLVKCPSMMPKLILWELRFRDTCSDIKKILAKNSKSQPSNRDEAGTLLLGHDTSFNYKKKHADELLPSACRLAGELNSLKEIERWNIISNVWVEMLCYAASHCGWTQHC